MGYYEDIGRAAGERAREKIEREGITSASEKWKVQKEELGGAVKQAVVATVLTPIAGVVLLAEGARVLANKIFK